MVGVVAGTLGLIDAELEKAAPQADKDKTGDLAGVEVRGATATTVVGWTAFEAETSPVDEGGTVNTVDKFEF